MPELDGRLVARCLERQDKFAATLAGTGGDDKWQIRVGTRLVASTKMSRGNKKTKSINAGLVSMMARQLKISTPFFVDMVGCSKGWRDYILALYREGAVTDDLVRSALGLPDVEPIPTQ